MDRMNELLIRDKFTNPQIVAEILKGEVTPIARNFFLLSNDLIVRFKKENDKFIFNIEIEASRIKPFGNRII